MEQKKVTAIVTRAVRYNETDMILTLVSLEYGKITATAKGCLKPKAKLRYAAEPMNMGEYMLASSKDRFVVTDCAQIDAFSPITADLDKYYASAFVLEALARLSPISQPQFFLRAVSALKAMAYEDENPQNAVTDFLLGVLADGGYHLNFAVCNNCKCLLDDDCAFVESDGIVCRHCAGTDGIVIQNLLRSYLSGEDRDISKQQKIRVNLILIDIAYALIGLKISKHYFVE